MGLLARVEEFQNTHTQAQDHWELDNRYSKEERTQILGEIDSVMEQNRIRINEQTFTMKAQKKGWMFPLMVNLGALILFLLSFFLLSKFFGGSVELDKTNPQTLLLTEARLLEEVRKESELLVNQKNEELEEVRQQLRDIESQKEQIEQRYQLDLEELRSRLFSELELAVEQEKERLRAQGFAEEEIQRRLDEFRRKKEEEVESIIETERKALEEEKSRKEEELNRLSSQYRNELENLEKEKQDLEESYTQRLNQLKTEMENRQNETRQELTRAQRELASLAEEREQIERLNSQVSGFYASIQNSLENQNYQEAVKSLDLFKSFIMEGSYQSVPELSSNQDQDLFLINSLKNYTLSLMDPEKEAIPGPGAAFQDYIDRGQSALERGNWDDALDAFSKALGELPETYGSPALLDGLTRLGWEQRQESLQKEQSAEADIWLKQAAELAENEDWQGALDIYISHIADTPMAMQWDTIPASMSSLYQNWMNDELAELSRVAETDKSADLEAELEKYREDNRTLEAELDNVQQDRAALEAELEENLVQNRSMKDEITSLSDQIQSLQGQLNQSLSGERTEESVNPVDTAGAALDAENTERLMELQNRIAELNQELGVMRQNEELLKRISSSYRNYGEKEDRILSESTDSEALINAKGALNDFLEQDDLERLLPGFSERLKMYDRAFQLSGEKDITLELADYIFIYSTLQSREDKMDWLDEQIEISRSNELTEFFENLRFLAQE